VTVIVAEYSFAWCDVVVSVQPWDACIRRSYYFINSSICCMYSYTYFGWNCSHPV